MLNPSRIIINQKNPKSRKDHKCFVCHRKILKGEIYTYEKIIDLDEKWIYERKRHNSCHDPLNLKKIWELEEKIDLKKILAEWKQGEYHPRRAKKKIEVTEKVPVPNLFGVDHLALQEGIIKEITTMVIATSKDEALLKYNSLAEDRMEAPYCWNVVGEEKVREITACK